MLTGDVIFGKLVKDHNAQKGFKGAMELPDGKTIGIRIGYDGKLATYLKQGIGKAMCLYGNTRIVKIQDGGNIAVFEPQWKVESGSIIKRGRLTSDARYNVLQDSGKGVTNFNLAVNYGYGDKKETDFYPCTFWGTGKDNDPAKKLAEKGEKGQEIIVSGKLTEGKDKDGKSIVKLEVTGYQLINAPSAKTNGGNENRVDDWNSLGEVAGIDDFGDPNDIPFVDPNDEVPF